MLRLKNYLKPFIPLIALSIVLLFVQAMADLSLPDYMAHIVNNGIQQGGIENAVPLALRKSTMDKLAIFLNEEDEAAVLDSYTLVDADSADYNKYLADYP